MVPDTAGDMEGCLMREGMSGIDINLRMVEQCAHCPDVSRLCGQVKGTIISLHKVGT